MRDSVCDNIDYMEQPNLQKGHETAEITKTPEQRALVIKQVFDEYASELRSSLSRYKNFIHNSLETGISPSWEGENPKGALIKGLSGFRKSLESLAGECQDKKLSNFLDKLIGCVGDMYGDVDKTPDYVTVTIIENFMGRMSGIKMAADQF